MDKIKCCWEYAASVPSKEQISGIHGISHWKRVERFGLEMARKVPEVDTTVVSLFGCFHDFKRKDNGRDFTHGPHAAEALEGLREGLLAFLTDRQFAQLTQACREHTERTEPSGDITIDTCIDADRLDLPRVNITPNPEKMLTAEGKRLARKIAAKIAKESPEKFGGNIIEHVEQNILTRCKDVELATQRINAAVKEAERRKLDTLKMFVLSSYACLDNPDIAHDPLILNWFTHDEVTELQAVVRDYLSSGKTQDPFAEVLRQIFK